MELTRTHGIDIDTWAKCSRCAWFLVSFIEHVTQYFVGTGQDCKITIILKKLKSLIKMTKINLKKVKYFVRFLFNDNKKSPCRSLTKTN